MSFLLSLLGSFFFINFPYLLRLHLIYMCQYVSLTTLILLSLKLLELIRNILSIKINEFRLHGSSLSFDNSSCLLQNKANLFYNS